MRLPLLLLSALVLLPVRAHAETRKLLVFAPSREDSRFRRQEALLAHSRAQFRDRDLVRVDAVGGEPGAAGLRARCRVKAGSFRVLLIGKDGHVAYSGTTPVPLREISGRIDAMPMRRDEMRRRGR